MTEPYLFISYARADEFDREIGRRLKALLRRPLEGLAQIFLDEDVIEPGSLLDREIGRAIDASVAAALLVSPEFVDSDYVNDIELPAIFDRHSQDLCRIWPINLRPAVLRRHRYLEDRLLVPELDRPLRSLGVDVREQVLAEIGDDIVTFFEELHHDHGPSTATKAGPEDDGPVVDLRDEPTAEPAELVGVPDLPDGYLPRTELVEEIWRDLQTRRTAAIGGQRPGTSQADRQGSVGLHGQGGVGKTVLATAICHDPRTASAFPGGVVWVTAGEHADPVAVQAELVSALGQRPDFTSAIKGREALEQLLADQQAPRLIVIDDVWSPDVVVAIPPPTNGRRLITTRDGDRVLRPSGITARTVTTLTLDQARSMTATRMGLPETDLPPGVDEVLDATGGNALLVRVVASALALGASPGDLLGRVRIDGEAPHPYLRIFRVLRAATAELDHDVAQRYATLAVFPPDTDLPVETITRWWTHLDNTTPNRTAADLVDLANRDLVTLDNDQGIIRLHDHQHDFVRYECTVPPRLLHTDLLNALALAGDGPTDLATDDPYLRDHLVAHLNGAGRDVAAVILDGRYLARRVLDQGVYAAVSDLEQAGPEATAAARTLRAISHWLSTLDDERTLEQTIAAWTNTTTDLPTLRPTPAWPLNAGSALTLQHDAAVNDVAWSPDGTRLATASHDATVRVWDAVSRDHLTTLTGHTRTVESVGWSPDGTRLATASHDATVRVWDAVSGDHLTTLTGHTDSVWSVGWSPDGTRLATASHDATVRVWDAVSGDHLTTLTGHTDSVWSVGWSPDGTRLATASYDETVRVWDAVSGDHLTTLTGHTDSVGSVGWSPDGTRLATASYDETVRVWDAVSGDHLTTLTGHTHWVGSVGWSPDGTRLATASRDETVRVWDAVSGDHLTTLTGHTHWVGSVGWSPDGTRLATASTDRTVRVWDPVSRDHLTTLTNGRFCRWGGHPMAPASPPPATTGRCGSGTRSAGTTSPPSPATPARFSRWGGHPMAPASPPPAPTGRCGYGTQSAETTSPPSPATPARFSRSRGHPMAPASPPPAPTGRCGYGTQSAETTSPPSPATPARFGRWGGHPMAPASPPPATTTTVRVWDPVSGDHLTTLTGHTRPVQSVGWSPDGTRLATASRDETVRVWDAVSGDHLTTLTGHTHWVRSVGWSPDGTRLATASDDNTVRVWDVREGGSQAPDVVLSVGEPVSSVSWGPMLAITFHTRVAVLQFDPGR